MFMKTRKILMVVSLVLIIVMPFMIASAPAQEVVPSDGGGEKTALDLLAPVGDVIGKVVTIVIGLAMFLFGTVQGTQITKIVFPKATDPGGWWYKARPYVLRAMSTLVAIWAMVGLKFDAFAVLGAINDTFTVDPLFGQLFSGLALGFASNKYYDKYEKGS